MTFKTLSASNPTTKSDKLGEQAKPASTQDKPAANPAQKPDKAAPAPKS